VHAGGLRYHGDAPSLCQLVREGVVEASAIPQTQAFDAAVRFARAEGIVPAPEAAHALRAGFIEAERARQSGQRRVILIGLSGHGHFDMSAYDAYHAGQLQDLEFSEADVRDALAHLPTAPSISAE
jgi:tryptophan synthase beta chain